MRAAIIVAICARVRLSVGVSFPLYPVSKPFSTAASSAGFDQKPSSGISEYFSAANAEKDSRPKSTENTVNMVSVFLMVFIHFPPKQFWVQRSSAFILLIIVTLRSIGMQLHTYRQYPRFVKKKGLA
jgi:hypothetical protein